MLSVSRVSALGARIPDGARGDLEKFCECAHGNQSTQVALDLEQGL